MADTSRLLSTTDNPWNPWTHFNEWLAYDMAAGHFTLPYLARVTWSSDELSQADQDLAHEQAIDEVLRLNINGLYVGVDEPK